MIDIRLVRENPDLVRENTKNRGYEQEKVDKIIKLDEEWRKLKKQDDSLRAERNKISKKINELMKTKKKEEAEKIIKQANKIKEDLSKNEEKEDKLKQEIESLIITIPNIQHKDNPIGDESKNKELLKWGKKPKIKSPKSHLELGEALDIIDIKRATKLSGAGFYILKSQAAKLQRALIQYFLDFHEKNKFIEINPPQLVTKKAAFGTGNLPKFENDLYLTRDDLLLIPTAEVPLTNIHSEETLKEKELPKKYTGFTECYRTEAGRRAGEEGLFRLHQFEKVEMVYICHPDDSWKFLEEMTSYSEQLLKNLEIPYRKLLLATQDASFASARTYDLEVWSPAMNRYLECSSCSNCTDFQARRMNTRFQSTKTNKPEFVHTLNGSGLALPRLLIAILENNQQADGSIKIPKVLHKYTGFKEIKPKKEKD